MTEISPGRAAYEAYAFVSDGKSLVSGVPLPAWDGQRPEIREAWRAAADAAVMLARLQEGRTVTGDGVDALAELNEMAHLNTSQGSLIRDLRAALSSLTDRAEAGRVITGDEADEYRRLAAEAVPVPEADCG